MSEYTPIGTIKKPHGLHGFLKVELEKRFQEAFMKSEVFFIETKGNFAPYFRERVEGGAAPTLKLEDVNSKEQAQRLSSKMLYLRKADLQDVKPSEETEATDDLEAWIGFTIEDDTLGVIGIIQDVIEMPMQLLAVLEVEDKEVFIPLHEELILDIKPEEKWILMELPEGLIQL